MSVAGTLALEGASREKADEAQDVWLRSRSWDRIFMVGGALLVPIPILTYYVCQALGMPIPASEDVVTLLVMILVGGPHVFGTYTRTYMNPEFKRRDCVWFVAGFLVLATVISATIMSAFHDVTWFGFPPITFILTFFFFWAGLHIVQQMSYCMTCYDEKRAAALGHGTITRGLWRSVDYLVVLSCLYPMSLFRMSMVQHGSGVVATANPDALSTQLFLKVTGLSMEAADQYVFRIGRVSPILPEFMMASAFWILVTAGFFGSVILFAIKSRREKRLGILNRPKFQLVVATAIVGFTVPFFPNLDSAFQGFNAWHSFQYLGLLWLMNRTAQERGETQRPFVHKMFAERRQWRFYATALGVTVGALALFFGVAFAIERASGGKFALFGFEASEIATNPDTGKAYYRPGALLLAYYLCGFGFLLVHYLHDGVFFFRTRYLVNRTKAAH